LNYPLYKDSVVSSSLSVNGKSFELSKDYLNNNSNYSFELPSSEVVFAGYGIVDDKMDNYKDLDVRGKVVLIIEGTPADYKSAQTGGMSPGQTLGKLQSASKKGAVAVLLVSKSLSRPANNRGAGWSLNGYRSNFNPQLFYISEKVATEIMGENGKGIFDKMMLIHYQEKLIRQILILPFKKQQ
jgi:hypothetical protein